MIPKKSKDFLRPLTLEEIKEKVSQCKKGFYEVEFLAGSPIETEHGTLYITTKMSYRFRLNYGKNKIVRTERAIYKSTTKEEVDNCNKIISLLSEEQKSCLSKRALNTLTDKQDKLSRGVALVETKRPAIERLHDEEVPNIVYCKNGAIVLTVYKSFQYNVQGKAYRRPETHYYVAQEDGVVELDSGDPTVKAALEKAKATSRAAAGKKKESKPSLVYTIGVGHVLSISTGKKKK